MATPPKVGHSSSNGNVRSWKDKKFVFSLATSPSSSSNVRSIRVLCPNVSYVLNTNIIATIDDVKEEVARQMNDGTSAHDFVFVAGAPPRDIDGSRRVSDIFLQNNDSCKVRFLTSHYLGLDANLTYQQREEQENRMGKGKGKVNGRSPNTRRTTMTMTSEADIGAGMHTCSYSNMYEHTLTLTRRHIRMCRCVYHTNICVLIFAISTHAFHLYLTQFVMYHTDLVGALEVGATGKKNQFLRAVFRRAVELQYDQAKAEARLNAAQSGQYTIEESNEVVVLSTGASAQMKVIFAKGAGFRGNYEETVELLDRDKVKGVIGLLINTHGLKAEDEEDSSTSESAREMLKPINMAKCSPRMFWSLVRLFGANMEDAFITMFPEHDWSFLQGRRKLLSEKAINNKRQAKEAQLLAEERKAKRYSSTSSGSSSSSSSSSHLGQRYPDLPTPFNFILPEELLQVFSVNEVAQLIRGVTPLSAYDLLDHYVTDSSFKMIFNENDMHIPASNEVDEELLERLYMTPDSIEELKSVLFTSLVTHLCTLLVKKDLPETVHTDAVSKVQHIMKTSGICNLQLFSVWRHSPGVAAGIFIRAAEALDCNAEELFAFSEENMLQAATLGNIFSEKCPWAKDEVFQF